MQPCLKARKSVSVKILCILACLCASGWARAGETGIVGIRIHQRQYRVEVAATPQARAKGLMFRRSLEKNTGMLFVYPAEDRRCFYMKNTFIPLDIAFINRDLQIVDIRQMQPLDKTPVCSREKVRYALEVNSGFFDRHGIQVGDTVEFAGAAGMKKP
ncbi:MAG: DUF192 domain-containing protein [Desulfobacteraceae bacterium]|nr:DUF192 domain-containing protein [Desulfobacteraceae bacterium]